MRRQMMSWMSPKWKVVSVGEGAEGDDDDDDCDWSYEVMSRTVT